MAKWYYAVGTETAGPVDEDELRAMAVAGGLRPTTYVVPEGDTVWVRLDTVEDRLALHRDAGGAYRTAPPAPEPEPWPPVAEPWPTVPDPLVPGGVTPDPARGVTIPAPAHEGTPSDPDRARPVADPGTGSPTTPAAPAAPGAWDAPPWDAPPWGPAGWPPGHPAGGDPWAMDGAGPARTVYASWGMRFAAKLVDSLILLVPTVVVVRIVAWQDVLDVIENARSSADLMTASGPIMTANLIAAVIGYAYFAVLNGLGRTPGKVLVGIRVVRATDGAPIGVTKGLLRHGLQFLQIVPGLSALIGVFVLVDAVSPLWDDRRRALHDRFAGSVVVRDR